MTHFLKLAIYYISCACIVKGYLVPESQRLNSLTFDNAIRSSENSDTLTNTYPNKSNYDHQSDISDNVVVFNGYKSHDNTKDMNADKNQKDKRWINTLADNAISINGREINLKGDMPVIHYGHIRQVKRKRMDTVSKGYRNLKTGLSDNKNDKALVIPASIPVKPYVAEHLLNRINPQPSQRHRRSIDIVTSSDLIPLRRQKRGIRSGVLDRIAHGFGKRTPSFGSADVTYEHLRDSLLEPEFGKFREDRQTTDSKRVISTAAWKRVQDMLTEQPSELDSEIEQALGLLQNLMFQYTASKERPVTKSEQEKDNLKKLLNKFEGFKYEVPEQLGESTYENTVYR